uniref:HORMA domain-containing protein n=1 Tax=Caenorhabditis tropicalis TaxID=1561998 RepID=A0A1I7T6T9_9PELO
MKHIVSYQGSAKMSDGNTTTIISLRGAAQLIKDYFRINSFNFFAENLNFLAVYGTNSYLYRRAVLPATTFQREKKYGVTMLVATGQNVKVLMASALLQVDYYLAKGQLKRLVSVISAVETKEVVERWQFDIHTDGVAAERRPPHRNYICEDCIWELHIPF